jgi:hypothetical protein
MAELVCLMENYIHRMGSSGKGLNVFFSFAG